ncbi:MAG: hypothetical protein HUU38_08985 [Anaerolineales bacterium]|nr:hypothetical protein [Anaerolineales bacterium]
MTKVNLTPLFVAFALIVIVGLALAGGVRALANSYSPTQFANAARTDALTAETVRHTSEMNLIAEQHARDLAANKLATAVSAETAWRNLYNYGGGALIVLLVILAFLRMARGTTDYLAWREVKNNEARQQAQNPAWTPAGPMLMSRNEAGREKLLCQLSGAEAFTDDREQMKFFVLARMQVVPAYLETLATLQRDVALEQAKQHKRNPVSPLPHPTIDILGQGF